MKRSLPGINRSSIYRNIQMLRRLQVIQEVILSDRIRRYQFIFDQPRPREGRNQL